MKLSSESAFEFLELISTAATLNPFCQARLDIDSRIIRDWLPDKKVRPEDEVDTIAEFTSGLLAEIAKRRDSHEANSTGRQRVLRDATLFSIFHKYTREFDVYIEKQNSSPGMILEVGFAGQLESDLSAHGFRDKAEHYIAIFFQMRRAFFFISQLVGGASAPVQGLREKLWRTLFTNDLRAYIDILFDKMESFSVLLLGETGVGKGQVAAALGRSAYIPFDRRTRRFVASFLDIFISANLSEYPETLVESELFGHKKGSFTGALENHSGLFGQTHPNGVLFLDEIGELDIPVQVKILRVLQERIFSPVGSHEKKRFAGRLIAATNANLVDKVKSGSFRSDLYHRLASDVIVIPALRERFAAQPEEERLLVARVCRRMFGRTDVQQEASVHALLKRGLPENYPWPGNLREFEQIIRRIVLHGESWDQDFEDSMASAGAGSDFEFAAHVPRWEKLRWTADELMAHYAQSAYESLGSYEKVAQSLGVDWRTAKRWISVGRS